MRNEITKQIELAQDKDAFREKIVLSVDDNGDVETVYSGECMKIASNQFSDCYILQPLTTAEPRIFAPWSDKGEMRFLLSKMRELGFVNPGIVFFSEGSYMIQGHSQDCKCGSCPVLRVDGFVN